MLPGTINRFQIILASNSPRRKELLSGMGLQFTVHQSGIDELIPESVPLENMAEYFARRKAEDVAQCYNLANTIVIGGDTTVLLDGELVEKPQNKKEAFDMLGQLSEKTHRVISAVCLVHHNKTLVYSDTAKVSFKKLRDEEINFYINKYLPFDKAGSYGIQEWIGYIGVNRIEGSFYTVMGLPTHLLWDMFKELITK
ncbi:MAG: Maf family protein [Lentimicrobiaceae bacterium]|nr:Maf family protein [Lentimicrobiaceae bacterium]